MPLPLRPRSKLQVTHTAKAPFGCERSGANEEQPEAYFWVRTGGNATRKATNPIAKGQVVTLQIGLCV